MSGVHRIARAARSWRLGGATTPGWLLAGAFLLFISSSAVAEIADAGPGERGFAGLGAPSEGFADVRAGRPLRFPEDHGQHPNYRIEWWYFTANLRDAAGGEYGVQWTLFRQALSPRDDPATSEPSTLEADPGWADRQVWMAHAAVTASDDHWFEERLARGGVGQAGVRDDPFEAWLDDWSAASPGPGVEQLALRARGAAFGYALSLRAAGPIAPQGQGGFSVKSEQADGAKQASYYYSQPHYEVTGTLNLKGEQVAVSGVGWMDHEWSSQPLAAEQLGWDWFSMHLSDGAKLMMFRLRRSDGAAPDKAGSWIEPDGRVRALAPADIQIAPLEDPGPTGAPTRWRLAVPSRGFEVETRALNPDAWQDGRVLYWEGPIAVEGTHEGRGFLEMTGYSR